MIGLPTNFVHTGHIGAGDVTENGGAVSKLSTVESTVYDYVRTE